MTLDEAEREEMQQELQDILDEKLLMDQHDRVESLLEKLKEAAQNDEDHGPQRPS